MDVPSEYAKVLAGLEDVNAFYPASTASWVEACTFQAPAASVTIDQPRKLQYPRSVAKTNIWGVTTTDDGRVFALGHPAGTDLADSPIFELVDKKLKLLVRLKDVEGIAGLGRQLLCTGTSFEEGPQMHVYDGKRWSTHDAGEESVHSLVRVNDSVIGVGRGSIARWDPSAAEWEQLTKVVPAMHYTGVAGLATGALVACGEKKRVGVLAIVDNGKTKTVKLPTTADLRSVATMPDGRIIAAGAGATVVVGTPPTSMSAIPAGKRKQDFGTVLVWEDRVLIAGRSDGILEVVDDELIPFSKEPGHRLAVAHGRLWRIDMKAGFSFWDRKAWRDVPVPAS